MNPAEWLVRSARLTPAAPALLSGRKLVADYACFAARAGAIGGALARDHAISPGARVAIFMTNCTEYLEALYGVWFAGGVVVPINAKLHPREAAWIAKNAGCALALVSGDVGAGLSDATDGLACLSVQSQEWRALYHAPPLPVPVPMDSETLAWLFYTSGTTGRPKGVMLSAGVLLTMTLGYLADVDTLGAGDAILYAAPMSHGAGLYNFMFVLKGARHVVPESHGFDAAEILTLAPDIAPVSMFAAPTMVKRLVTHARAAGLRGTGLRSIIYAGGPMYLADIIEAVEVMGDRFIQIYGQGECPMAITVLPRQMVSDRDHPRWRARLASVGTAQSPVRVRIADRDGNSLPTGEIGEILVRGPSVMQGYWQNPEASAAALREGWLWTGDMGAMDDDGFVTLHDRSKDMIISGGSNIYPREVEEVLLALPEVAEAAVVGRKHPDWGEEVVAFVVPTAGAKVTAALLDAQCIDNIARFKRPKAYRIVSALPKNNYGKVLKTELRARLGDEATGPQP